MSLLFLVRLVSLSACLTCSKLSMTSQSFNGDRDTLTVSTGTASVGRSGASDTTSVYVDAAVKIALSLYKVQQNIYLLDFQKVEVV